MKNARMALLLPFMLFFFVQVLLAQVALTDESDAAFTISDPVVTIISPNGGEGWNCGEAMSITWSLAGVVASVNIDYSLDNGSSWIPVAFGVGNTGVHPWTVEYRDGAYKRMFLGKKS